MTSYVLKSWGWLFVCVVGLGACGFPGGFPQGSSYIDGDELGLFRQDARIFAPELGKGVNSAETQTFAKCVVFPSLQKQDTAFQSRLYDEYTIENRQDLDQKLDTTAALNAKALWGSASSQGGYFKNIDIDEEAFYWLVDARYVLQHESIDTSSPDFALSSLAKRLLTERGIKAFIKACGTHFYVGRTLGARYNLLYEFKSHEDKFVQKVKAAANLSTFGIHAEAELNKFLSIAKQFSYLKIHSGIEGGSENIADYATDAASLKDELARLRQDVLVRRQGDVLRWEMGTYDIFPEVQAAQEAENHQVAEDVYKEDVLGLYYQYHTRNKQNIAHLTRLIAKAGGAEPWYVYSAHAWDAIRGMVRALQSQNEDIAKRAAHCLRDYQNECTTEGLQPIEVQDPTPDKDFSGLGTWSLYPIVRHGSLAMVDFYGNPGGDFQGRIFDTNQDLFSSPAGGFVMAHEAQGASKPLLIGSFDMFEGAAGRMQPKLCIDAFADVCTLRMVEDSHTLMADGYPLSWLQLVVFDAHGLQTDKYVFRIRP